MDHHGSQRGLEDAGAKYKEQEGVNRCNLSSGVKWDRVMDRLERRKSFVTGCGTGAEVDQLLHLSRRGLNVDIGHRLGLTGKIMAVC